jgi:flavodoxin
MAGVLVAYATKHGSTREVAEAVSNILRAEGAVAGRSWFSLFLRFR